VNRSMTWLAVPVLLVGVGCGKSKIAQCNAFIDEANKSQNAFNDIDNAIDKPAVLKQKMAQIEAATTKVQAVQLEDPKLKDLQKRYGEGLRGFTAALTNVSTLAQDPKKLALLEKAAKDLDKLGEQESKLIDEINTYCSGGK
jgi:hypothetical protein